MAGNQELTSVSNTRVIFLSKAHCRQRLSRSPHWSATDFEVLSVLVSCSQRSVYLTRCRYTGRLFCLKVYNKRELSNTSQGVKNSLEQVYREIHNHGKVTGHAGVVPLFCAFENNLAVVLVIEWQSESITLSTLFSGGKLSPTVAQQVTAGLLTSVAELHNSNVLHGDLKPENVLYNPKRNEIKLFDFGLSFDLSVERPTTPSGTLCYCAPEVVRSLLPSNNETEPGERQAKCEYGLKSDIWSCGVIIYQLLKGKLPFRGNERIACVRNILSSELPDMTGISEMQVRFLKRALEMEPVLRASALDLLCEQWLAPGGLLRIKQRLQWTMRRNRISFPRLPNICIGAHT
uniref:Serine threonine protein kinase n=2 Tax=Tetraselmis sp. GSL018 TaxID=582737 RepID=A0A061R4P2_9CHLO